MRYLRNVHMTRDRALAIWSAMYTHVLRDRHAGGDWLFVHFDDVVAGDGLDRIETATGASVDKSFPDRSLKHSDSQGSIPPETARVYAQLCDLSGHPAALAGNLEMHAEGGRANS